MGGGMRLVCGPRLHVARWRRAWSGRAGQRGVVLRLHTIIACMRCTRGVLPCNLGYKIRCAAWRPDDTHNLIYALSSCSVGFNCMMLYFATLNDEQL